MDAILWVAALAFTVRYAVVPWQRRASWSATYPYSNGVMTDFRDTVLLPWVAISHRVNPYDVTQYRHFVPYAQEFDPYCPWWLAVTRPFSLVGWDKATLAYSVCLAVLLSCASAASGVWIARALGHARGSALARLSTTRLALLMVIAVWLWRPATVGQGLGNVGALAASTAVLSLMSNNLIVGSLMLAVAWVKPQFGIPLVIVMLACGLWRRALMGTFVAALASVPMLVKLSLIAGGVVSWFRGTLHTLGEVGGRTGGEPLDGRLDLGLWTSLIGMGGSAVAMLVGSVILLVAARRAVVLRGVGMPDVALFLLSAWVVLAFPHLHYDLTMLLPGVVAVALAQTSIGWDRANVGARWPVLLAATLAAIACLFPLQSVLSGVEASRLQAVVLAFCGILLFLQKPLRPAAPGIGRTLLAVDRVRPARAARDRDEPQPVERHK